MEGGVIPFARNTFINLTRRKHKFLYLERATIADRQGASEDQKFVAKPTQLNINLFLTNGIITVQPHFNPKMEYHEFYRFWAQPSATRAMGHFY